MTSQAKFRELTQAEEREVYFRGIDLFNRGDFFEAHSVWEDVWRPARGAKRNFYQGLIQVAVALTHYQRGRPRGAIRLFGTAQRKLAGAPAGYRGLDRDDFLRKLRHLLTPLLEADEADRAGMRPEPTRLFRIELTGDPFAG
jgi:hypothetical protein